jgi:hypothetical protein
VTIAVRPMQSIGCSGAEPVNQLSAPTTAKGKLQRIALDYLREKHERGETPTSIRFVFYELEQRGLISKERPVIKPGCTTAQTPAQYLTAAITVLREVGLVPLGLDRRRQS